MTKRLWLIVEKATKEITYVLHGKEHDEPNWRTVGPFAFTDLEEAQAVAARGDFLPLGVQGSFDVLEVEIPSFIQTIYNGFPPMNTDVFILNQRVFPLTSAGADWVDDVLRVPVWAPLFDENGADNGLAWLDQVLQQVAHIVQVSMETVVAIGSLTAEDEDQETARLVERHVQVIVTPESGAFELKGTPEHHVLSPSSVFWLHTVGMDHFDFPELEIRHVPALYITAAIDLLKGIAADALDHGMVAGDEFLQGTAVQFRMRVVQSPDLFWVMRGVECLRIEVSQVLFGREKEKDTWGKPATLH